MSTSLPEFRFNRPDTLEEAINILNQYKENGCLLAGGTDLVTDMRARIKVPEVIIDLKGITELSEISYEEGKGLRVGATATVNDILNQPVLKERYLCLHDSLSNLCDAILRQRATVGGNICTGSPAGDSAPSLLVLRAQVEIQGQSNTRRVEIRDFFTDVKKTCVKIGEIVTAIIVPDLPIGTPSRYYKMKRGAEDLAVVGTAGIKYPDETILLSYSSVAPTPILIDVTEKIIAGSTLSDKLDAAVEEATKNIHPITDVRGSADYRSHLVDVTTRFVLDYLIGGRIG
ncbi:MAG: FAD binding domain-containing protein [Candidatus Hodarchaeales archaeon]